MIRHISTVAVYVEDQEDAVRFWTGKVGFEVRTDRSMGNARWVEVAPRGAATALVLYPKSTMPDWDQRRPSVVFAVDDIEDTCDRLAANGVDFEKPLAELPWGKFASFLDTEGNEIGLQQQHLH